MTITVTNVYIVKWARGAHGVKRDTFGSACKTAEHRASKGQPARVYRVGAPNVLLATVHVDGGYDFTPDGQAENREARS